jgi:arginyl-tRNA synthetase
MQVQQIYALLKIMPLEDRLQISSLALKYIPVGLVQHRSMEANYTVSEAIAVIRTGMENMVDNQDDSDDSIDNAFVVNTTTAAAFSGIFMETKRQKQIQLAEQPAKLLREKGQPMLYILYTRARLGAILNSYSTQNTYYNIQPTDSTIPEYTKSLAKIRMAADIAREILDYRQVTLTALDRGEPCLLVAFAVRLSRLVTRACNVLRVKNCPPSVALPRVHLLSMCERILDNVIHRLGMLPLERM